MQAWLAAYHDGDIDWDSSNGYLRAGNLPARSGSIQAAINIEVQDLEVGKQFLVGKHILQLSHETVCMRTDYVDVKIEGLNGKLPNLDMFNLVQRIMTREGVTSGYKMTPRKKRRSNLSNVEQNLRQMLAMLASQSSGVPNGNHGLFHRYRIDALTIAAAKRITNSNSKSNPSSSAVPLLKAIEGIARSLNNLLERFHQSFFFYVIVHNDRYISIGDYMPPLVLIVACSFIKAYLTWATLNATGCGANRDAGVAKPAANGNAADGLAKLTLPYGTVLIYLTVALLIGYCGNVLPLQQYFLDLPLTAAPLTVLILITLTLIGFVMPFVVVLPTGGLELLHVSLLLVNGCALIVIGLLNFSLGFFVAVLTMPLMIALNTNQGNAMLRNLLRVCTLLLNPLVVVYAIVLIMSFYEFPELTLQQLLPRALTAAMDAATFALIDSVVSSSFLSNLIDSLTPTRSLYLSSLLDLWQLAVLCH